MRVCIEYDDALVAELIHSSLSKYFNIENTSASEASLQWSSYESISFETILSNPQTLCNSYIFRKALIRKHFLANTITNWLSKHPESILSKSVPNTYLLECDYADYLDEALNECFELREELGKKLFILKPSMTDRGQGIRLFSTYEELQAIFEEFEENEDEDEDENEDRNENEEKDNDNNGVMASQLRHFVIQDYISPLLVDGRKFHIRAYVVAFGTIKVYVWSEMLALFASKPYSSAREMDRHLTNTCLQEGSDNVFEFRSLPISGLDGIFKQICEITGEVFMAAAAGQQMHFQTLPNAFEIFGVDFIVDEKFQVYLLEVNSFPDFKQTGQRLTDHVVGGLFDAVTRCIICPFFKQEVGTGDDSKPSDVGRLELVKEAELRGNW